jgi:hypothetical protein
MTNINKFLKQPISYNAQGELNNNNNKISYSNNILPFNNFNKYMKTSSMIIDNNVNNINDINDDENSIINNNSFDSWIKYKGKNVFLTENDTPWYNENLVENDTKLQNENLIENNINNEIPNTQHNIQTNNNSYLKYSTDIQIIIIIIIIAIILILYKKFK